MHIENERMVKTTITYSRTAAATALTCVLFVDVQNDLPPIEQIVDCSPKPTATGRATHCRSPRKRASQKNALAAEHDEILERLNDAMKV
jgi:hypothetical protein